MWFTVQQQKQRMFEEFGYRSGGWSAIFIEGLLHPETAKHCSRPLAHCNEQKTTYNIDSDTDIYNV